jgi:hypothetical protein
MADTTKIFDRNAQGMLFEITRADVGTRPVNAASFNVYVVASPEDIAQRAAIEQASAAATAAAGLAATRLAAQKVTAMSKLAALGITATDVAAILA